MAHYALLNSNNIVTQVITGKDEGGNVDWEVYYGNFHNQTCKRTSYNTIGGVHINGGTPFRKNYAGLGYTYDEDRDAFIEPQPFNSWTLNEDSCQWEAPTPYPEDGERYVWNEDTLTWDIIIEE